jgi:hypothetical protein
MASEAPVCDVCGGLLYYGQQVIQCRRGTYHAGYITPGPGPLLRQGHEACVWPGHLPGNLRPPYDCSDCRGGIPNGAQVTYWWVGTQPVPTYSRLESRVILFIEHIACAGTYLPAHAPAQLPIETAVRVPASRHKQASRVRASTQERLRKTRRSRNSRPILDASFRKGEVARVASDAHISDRPWWTRWLWWRR